MTKDCRPIFCSRHLSNTSSTSSTLTSAPRGEGEMGDDVGWSDGEEVVGLHVCTFKSATLAVWQYLCVCVLIFLFWRSLSSVPVKSCPPLNLWVSGTRRRNKNQKKRFHAVGRRQEDDVFTSTSAQLGCTRTHSDECRRIWCF